MKPLAEDKIKKIYVDSSVNNLLKPDDFIVAVGKTKSNSVYHVAEVRIKERHGFLRFRHYLKVFKSDLPTCIKRNESQALIPMRWYSRDKKQKK